MREKRYYLLILLLLLFLTMIPTTAFYAQRTADQAVVSDYDYVEHWFGAEATVQSVTEELKQIQPGITVSVIDKDGTPRTSGLLKEGDLVEMIGESGNVLQIFINLSPQESSALSSEDSNEPTKSDSTKENSKNTDDLPDSSIEESVSEISHAPKEEADFQTQPDSEAPSSAVTTASAVSEDTIYYKFSEPVTVAGLKNQLAVEGVSGSQLTVQTKTGNIRQDGAVCTGDILTVTNPDGTLQNRVTAVIAGDLARCGYPDEEACKILYDYLTDSGTLSADLRRSADLNEDETVTTSDLLQLKKMVFGDG